MISMVVINTKELPGVKVPPPNARELKVALDPTVGNYDKATILVSTIEPESSTGLHTHISDEIMYMVKGEGEAIEVRNRVQMVVPISEGCIIYAPGGIEHQIKNLGNSKLILFCVYIPGLKATGYVEEAIKKSKSFFAKEKIEYL